MVEGPASPGPARPSAADRPAVGLPAAGFAPHYGVFPQQDARRITFEEVMEQEQSSRARQPASG